mgnify:CR=1 FL=1
MIITSLSAVDPASLGGRLSRLSLDLQSWLSLRMVDLLAALLAGAVIAAVLLGLRRLGRRIGRRDPTGRGWTTIFGNAISKTGNFLIWAIVFRLVATYAAAPPWIAEPARVLFIVAVTVQAAIWAREIILGFVERRTEAGESETLGSAIGIIRLLVTVVVSILAGIVVLDNIGVNVTGLVAGLGIGGIAIGLAAQGIFADLFAALSILFDRPFRRGDGIAYDQTVATVEEIGLKSTRLRAISGEERIIANKQLLDKEIRNNSRLTYRRAKFALALVYQLPPAKAAALPALLRDIVETAGHVFVRAGFVGFGQSSLDFEVEFDVMSEQFEAFYDGRHAVGIAIIQRFAEEGLEFAYPTQTTFTAAPDGTMVLPYPPYPFRDGEPGRAG